ncbi:unnamed protein product [Vitrella brassicaformis CCMP3155]|uniref:Translation elongation factor EF1B beta/delta subunit guanine nucleotide exchange domain-containing protein n=2 Tax=Vitrella brassicaformis TaxID=1169539 RepID=A0A0G4EIV4_VITBC|nr:unnamed protein product [Vitrella brassicaformis CCMP3155]|eukprot:CEL96945.1 unnamed protein product [Vitrella brassicaformis CCMP3155]
MVEFGNLKTDAGIAKLNTHLEKCSYITGFIPTQNDVTCLGKMLACPDGKKYPHAARWYRHIAHYTPVRRKMFPKGEMGSKKPDDEDDIDLFGEETEADKEAAKKLAESKKAEAEKSKKKKVEKSLLLIDCKPFSSDTNLDKLAELVKQIKMEGLEWKEQTKKIPMAFGLNKLQVGCVIQDDLVSTDLLCELIENVGMTEEQIKKRKELEEAEHEEGAEDEDEEDLGLVQSVEIAAFNKL